MRKLLLVLPVMLLVGCNDYSARDNLNNQSVTGASETVKFDKNNEMHQLGAKLCKGMDGTMVTLGFFKKSREEILFCWKGERIIDWWTMGALKERSQGHMLD